MQSTIFLEVKSISKPKHRRQTTVSILPRDTTDGGRHDQKDSQKESMEGQRRGITTKAEQSTLYGKWIVTDRQGGDGSTSEITIRAFLPTRTELYGVYIDKFR